MENLSIKEILNATNGTLLCGNPNTFISSVSTNSNEIEKGSLFVPIKGQKTDAHDFIIDAFNNGAVASLSENKTILNNTCSIIHVKNTKNALQDLAKYYRKKFKIPVIGVTGSVGKTTTKEIIASAMRYYGKILKTNGNQNSQIGVPLTVFNINNSHKAAIIEMGMSEFHEMEKISQIAMPNMAVITNIGISHIENLKTKENILSEKLHITDCFNNNSVLFLNGNDPLLRQLDKKNGLNKVYYGFENFCDYKAENIRQFKNETHFNLVSNKYKTLIKIPTIGTHNVLNALVAIAIADKMNITIDKIKLGLLTYKPPLMRQTFYKLKNLTLIDDSYNASPDSAASGINVLKSVANGRTIAVIADMLELGSYSKKAHFDLGKLLATQNIDIIIAVGSEAIEITNGAKSINKNISTKHFYSNDDTFKYLKNIIKKDDTIIVKGSRGMHMDNLVKKIINFYN